MPEITDTATMPTPVPRPRRPRRIPATAGRYRTILSYAIVSEPRDPADRELLSEPEAVARWARGVIDQDSREHFWVACLDSQNRLIASHHVSMGSLSASIVHPREVFRAAVLAGAAHLVLAHNHPSGDPTPSKEDVHLTRQLVDGARLLGLRIHDHVIIGDGRTARPGWYVSLTQRGLV